MTDRRSLALLVALHLAVVAIVQPRGEFPLNDDWAYAHSVQWLLAEHRIRLSDWIAMNLLPQTLLGGATAALFGFSFEALRHLTQAVAVLASFAAYAWFRALRLAPADALAAAVAVIAFPAWPVLANSYMTDVYGLALGLASAALFVRALGDPARGTLIAATLVAIAGVWQRQVVLVVPFAFMVARLWTRYPWSARGIVIAVAPLAAAFAAEFLYRAYLAAGPGIPEAQQFQHGRLLRMLGDALVNRDGHTLPVLSNFLTIGGYFGLFVAGWGLWWGMPGTSRGVRIAVIAGGLAIGACLIATDTLPPFRPNQVIDPAGIGPFTLHDAFRAGDVPIDRAPGALWRAAALAAGVGAAALLALVAFTIAHLVRARGSAQPERVFLAAAIAGYLGPFIAVDYFDRYLLFVLPFVIALWALAWPRTAPAARSRRLAAAAALAAVIGLSASATRDYFSWNRERWDMLRAAEALGATPDEIDGGFEYNGFKRHEIRPRGSTPGKLWWWVKDDRYIVAFTELQGYETVQRGTVKRWLASTPAEVRLLRRR